MEKAREQTGADLSDPGLLTQWLGGSRAARMGLRPAPDDDAALWRWWLAACLLADRMDEAVVAAIVGELARRGGGDAAGFAALEPDVLAAALAGAGHRRAEPRAAQLLRAAASLTGRFDGSLCRVAAEADGPDALGAALVGLAPGIGTGTVQRFLSPLRTSWPAAAELPLSRAAAAAAQHLGWLAEGDDDAGVLLRIAKRAGVDPADLEPALEELGRRACLRGQRKSCPHAGCPLR